MSETSLSSAESTPAPAQQVGLWSGRRGRKLRESLLAYALLLPAMLIVGIFGLFPLVFALYQSTLRGLNTFTGRYDGLFNYVRAIDNLAYVLGFWIAIFFAGYAVYQLTQTTRRAREAGDRPWMLLAPALLATAGAAVFARLTFSLMGELLLIPSRLTSIENRSAEFRQLIGETLRLPTIARPFGLSVLLIVLSVGLFILINRNMTYSKHNGSYYGDFTVVSLLLALAAFLGWFTFVEVQGAYTDAFEAGEDLRLWAQIITISAGIVLLGLSWLLWDSAKHRDSTRGVFLRLMGGAVLLVGAWVLIGELPAVVAEGNDDWWTGLRATIFYSGGTVPLQLAIGLLLAVLLFQDFRGKGLYRVVYFLPYITPTVAAAAVFRVFFSSRPSGPMNSVLTSFGLDPLGWLAEPAGVIQLIVGDGAQLNAWLAGPSLALVVIMIYSIWTFVGFNVVIFLAGLGNIGRDMYEAASIDGAGRWEQFRHITLPLLSPTIYFLTLWSVIGTFKAFNHIWVLRLRAALGTTDTASVVIFNAFKRDTRYGYASALAVLLLILILILTYINNRVSRDRVFYG